MVFIYILKLEQDKYYVGKTTNPDRRLLEHNNSQGASWTKLYKPIEVLKLIPNCNNFDEDKYTLEYMNLYGMDNVRGGSFCSVILSTSDKYMIQKMLKGGNDKCFICGKGGHFANKCRFNRNNVPNNPNNKLSRQQILNMMQINRIGCDTNINSQIIASPIVAVPILNNPSIKIPDNNKTIISHQVVPRPVVNFKQKSLFDDDNDEENVLFGGSYKTHIDPIINHEHIINPLDNDDDKEAIPSGIVKKKIFDDLDDTNQVLKEKTPKIKPPVPPKPKFKENKLSTQTTPIEHITSNVSPIIVKELEHNNKPVINKIKIPAIFIQDNNKKNMSETNTVILIEPVIPVVSDIPIVSAVPVSKPIPKPRPNKVQVTNDTIPPVPLSVSLPNSVFNTSYGEIIKLSPTPPPPPPPPPPVPKKTFTTASGAVFTEPPPAPPNPNRNFSGIKFTPPPVPIYNNGVTTYQPYSSNPEPKELIKDNFADFLGAFKYFLDQDKQNNNLNNANVMMKIIEEKEKNEIQIDMPTDMLKEIQAAQAKMKRKQTFYDYDY
jgi:hypothetical protein